MLLPDSGAGKFPGEQAHVPGQQKPLLPGHVPQCFFLNRLRFRSCIRHHHGVMVACAGKGFGYAYAGETLGPRR